MSKDWLIPLSALQHYVYCPRQCALIHIERLWTENYWTAQGRVLHQKTDEGKAEQRVGLRIERSVDVVSHRLGIQGKLDVLEVSLKDQTYTPVEYKRGKPKTTNCDKVQLCAQALCLEDMLGVEISRAAIWYWQVRKREWVDLNESLREETCQVISHVHVMFANYNLPLPVFGKHCQACSLMDECQPKVFEQDSSDRYVQSMFEL